VKKVIHIDSACRLNTENRQLKIWQLHSGEEHQIPIEDIQLLMVAHPTTTLSLQVLRVMAQEGVAVALCGNNFQPISLCLPLEGHTLHSKRLQMQAAVAEPIKKRAWQLTVQSKIQNQAMVIKRLGKDNKRLVRYSSEVLSNDKGNTEAKAAKVYWNELFGGTFTRGRYGDWPNAGFNYVYAIVRSTIARAIVGSGLSPALGYHHMNQYNAFCLADDLIEPYRPLADEWLLTMNDELIGSVLEEDRLPASVRRYLQDVLNRPVLIEKKKYPMATAIDRTVDSYVAFLERKKYCLLFPK
jgi:CRISPR-associated protein Cas1